MKVRALAFLLGVFLVFATAAGVLAQSAPAPAAPPDSTTQSDSATKGNADVKAEGKVEKPPAEGPAPKSDQRSDVNVNIDRKSRVEGCPRGDIQASRPARAAGLDKQNVMTIIFIYE